MLNLYLCITQDHNLLVLLLAAAVCVVSAFAGLFMLDRARQRSGVSSFAWLIAAGAVFGGGAVWTTHFVAMLGYDVGMPISFRAAPTFGSALIGMFGALLAFAFLRRGNGELWRIAAAGVTLGLSIVGMHYTGMNGVLVPGAFTWAPSYVAASILMSVGFSVLCMLVYVQMRGDTLRPTLRRLGAATGVGVLAVCSLHFTAMTGLSIAPDGSQTDQIGGLSRSTMAGLIGARAMFLVIIALAAAAVDAILSDRRRAEEIRLRALVAQLQESERRLQEANRAKSLFLSRMSHEFRTPLNGIIGLATMLKHNAAGEQAGTLAMIVNCGQSLGAMVNDILDLARFEDGEFVLQETRFDLSGLLTSIATQHQAAARDKGLRLSVMYDHNTAPLVGDVARIGQIVSGLVSNAVKFTEEGEIVVRAKATAEPGGRVALQFVVEDTGVGVPEDASIAIFEPFAQADMEITRKHEGAGLGLPLAQRLCAAMDGHLDFERLAHGGTRFCATVRVNASPQDSDSGWPANDVRAA